MMDKNSLNITINLKDKDLESLITEALASQFPNHRVKSVSFKVGVHGDDRFGGGSYGFNGVDVVLEPKADGIVGHRDGPRRA